MKFLILISVLILTGCNKENQFKPGECVDREDWVLKDGSFVGTSFKKIAGVTKYDDYIYRKWSFTKEGKLVYYDLESGPLSAHIKIDCPTKPNDLQ